MGRHSAAKRLLRVLIERRPGLHRADVDPRPRARRDVSRPLPSNQVPEADPEAAEVHRSGHSPADSEGVRAHFHGEVDEGLDGARGSRSKLGVDTPGEAEDNKGEQ